MLSCMTPCPTMELASAVVAKGAPLPVRPTGQAAKGWSGEKNVRVDESRASTGAPSREYWKLALTMAGVGGKADRVQSEAARPVGLTERVQPSLGQASTSHAVLSPVTEKIAIRDPTAFNPAPANIQPGKFSPVTARVVPGAVTAQRIAAVHHAKKHREEKAVTSASLVQHTVVSLVPVAIPVPAPVLHPPVVAPFGFAEAIAPRDGKDRPQPACPIGPDAQPAYPAAHTPVQVPAQATEGAPFASPQRPEGLAAEAQTPVPLPVGTDEAVVGKNGAAEAKQGIVGPALQAAHPARWGPLPAPTAVSSAPGMAASLAQEPSPSKSATPAFRNSVSAGEAIPPGGKAASFVTGVPTPSKPLALEAARRAHALELPHPAAENRTHAGPEAGRFPLATTSSQGQAIASVSSSPTETRLRAQGATEAPASSMHAPETFAAMDAAGPAGPTWVHVGARKAEAGFQDPSLGWVSVRAEAGGGGIHAALVGGTVEAAQSLSAHLAGLHAFLEQLQTPLQSIHVTPAESAWIGAGAHAGMQQGNPQQGAGHHDASSRRPEPVHAPVTARPPTPTSAEALSFQQNDGACVIHFPEGSQISVVA